MCRRVLAAVLFTSSMLAAAPCRAGDQWIEVKSAHFTIVSNAGQWSARNLAWQMEQIRSAMAAIWPWAHLELSRPFVVLGANDEQSMRALVPKYWEEKGSVHPISVWVDAGDRYYLAVRSDIKGEDYRNRNPYLTSYFIYVLLILRQSVTRPLPLWLERGLAGVLSNTVVSDQQVLIGPVIPAYLRDLRDGPRSRIADLVKMTHASPAFRGDEGMRQFDAQAWELVHFLWFGDQGAHSAALQHFMDAVQAGGDPDKAFREAIGPPEALEGPLNAYGSRSVFSFQQLQVDAAVKREAFPVRPLPVPESASMRALLHAAMNRPVEARRAIDDARKAGGPAPESYVAEAELLEHEGKSAEARTAYQRAVDDGSTSGYAYRRLASLMWQSAPTHDELVQIEKLLAKATALNNRDDYAYAMLGDAHSQLGEPDGLGFARRAVSLAPTVADHHLAVARILARERKYDEAQKELQAATALARSDDEQRRINELAQWLEKARGSARGSGGG
jgi:tetratricopeptide (TPR) repeat protein